MTDRELMQQAREALENNPDVLECDQYWPEHQYAIAALRDRLAQPEQAPMALETIYETIIQWDEGGGKRSRRELARRIMALYTAAHGTEVKP
jgi:hypothetical protein